MHISFPSWVRCLKLIIKKVSKVKLIILSHMNIQLKHRRMSFHGSCLLSKHISLNDHLHGHMRSKQMSGSLQLLSLLNLPHVVMEVLQWVRHGVLVVVLRLT